MTKQSVVVLRDGKVKMTTEEEKMNAFEQIKSELIRRGYDSARADAQAASYTRGMNDDAILTDEDVEIACDQIDEMD